MHPCTTCNICQSMPAELYSVRINMINYALDKGSWPANFVSDLMKAELSVWLINRESPDPDNAGGADSITLAKQVASDKRAKHKKGSSSDGKGAKRTKSPEEEKAKEKEHEKSKDRNWRNSIESAISKLTSVVTNWTRMPVQEREPVSTAPNPETSTSGLTGFTIPCVSMSSGDSSYSVDQGNVPSTVTQRDLAQFANDSPPPGGRPASPLQTRPAPAQVARSHVRTENPPNKEESDDETLDQDIGRIEKKRMFVKGLRDLAPHLPHVQEEQDTDGAHFALLAPKNKGLAMPFLPEIFQQLCRVGQIRDRKVKDPFKGLKRFYPSSELVEAGVLASRSVPRELLTFVPADKITAAGASGRKATLRKTTPEGQKDEAAAISYHQAAGYLRLSNNSEIWSEVAQSLIKWIDGFAGELLAKDSSSETKAIAREITRVIWLLETVMFDMKSTNSDLIKGALYQYQGAIQSRREAWLAASRFSTTGPYGFITAVQLFWSDWPRCLRRLLPYAA